MVRMASKGTAVIALPADTQILITWEFDALVPNERLVCTEVYEGVPEGDGPPVLATYTFTEKDGRTTLTLLIDAPNRDVRDVIMSSGMESGMQDGWDLVEQLAISLIE